MYEFGSSGHGGGREAIAAYFQIQLNWNRHTEEIKLYNANPSQQTTVLGISQTCEEPPREIRTSDGRFYRLYNESVMSDPAAKLESVTCKEGVFEHAGESGYPVDPIAFGHPRERASAYKLAQCLRPRSIFPFAVLSSR